MLHEKAEINQTLPRGQSTTTRWQHIQFLSKSREVLHVFSTLITHSGCALDRIIYKTNFFLSLHYRDEI